MWTVAEDERGIATSAGGGALDRTTDAYMKVICIAPGGRSGYASDMAVAAGGARPDGRRPSARPPRRRPPGEPVELPPGEYPVVMEPRAVGTLLEQLAESALNGLLHAEGRGGLVDRLGERVAAPSINLADSPLFPGTLPRAFDAEGTPKRPLPADPGRDRPGGGARPAQRRAGGDRVDRATRSSRAARRTGRCRPTSSSRAAARPTSTTSARPSSAGST